MVLIDKIVKNINNLRGETSVDKLSRASDVPTATIWKILRKEVNDVRVSTLIGLAKALKCKLDDLVK